MSFVTIFVYIKTTLIVPSIYPSVMNNDNTPVQCSICLDNLPRRNRKTIQLGCSHIYHAPCILDWFKRNASCPLCRNDLLVKEEEIPVVHEVVRDLIKPSQPLHMGWRLMRCFGKIFIIVICIIVILLLLVTLLLNLIISKNTKFHYSFTYTK